MEDQHCAEKESKQTGENGDIVQQIKEMYMGKSKAAVCKPQLIPTKAALFGLDVRFREVDARLKAEDDERNALKRRCKSGGGAGR